MAVSALLSLGVRAMQANYSALSVIGNNISNANTPGYSVQSAKLETAFSQQTSSGFFGKGVNVTTVTRAHDEFLTRESALTASAAANDAARNTHLKQLEGTFRTGEAGIGSAAQVMFNSFVDVASKPQDSAARQVALAQVSEVAARFRAAGDQISAMQSGVSAELKASIGTVNTLTAQIASLNQRIANSQGSGQPPNDLLDQRDSAINDLSKLVSLTTVQSSDGSVAVFIGGGQRIVLGAQSTPLAAVPDPFDSSKVQLGIVEGTSARAFPDGYVSGGAIAGLLAFQNQDLTDARNLVGQMASAITGAINLQQSLGLDLRVPPTSGSPLLGVGAPQTLASANNAKSGGVPVASYVDVTGLRVPSVAITTVDSSQLRASDYQLFADPALPAGTYKLTRLSDGTATNVTNGAVVDGFKISVVAPAPVVGDRFLLKPVGNAIGSMVTTMDDPKGIAAASPVIGTIGVGNSGTATIASVNATSVALNPNLKATLTFTSPTAYTYTLVDTTGTLPTASSTGTWAPDKPITLNGWAMKLNGVPATGDTLVVEKTPFPSGNNGNANALLALRDSGILGRVPDGSGGLTAGLSVTDAYSDTIANIGVRVQRAGILADQSASLAAQAKTAETSNAGVNLDEEAARLIQFQQSYQAAAKMLQVAQTMFDTILSVTSR